MLYPVDSVIHLLNNPGLVMVQVFLQTFRNARRSLGERGGELTYKKTGLFVVPLSVKNRFCSLLECVASKGPQRERYL